MIIRALNRRPGLGIGIAAVVTTLVLSGVFAAMVLRSRAELRAEIHRRIIERNAAVLQPFAAQQVADDLPSGARSPLIALLRSARQEGMLAIAIFDAEGTTIEAVPGDQLFVELPLDDHMRLQAGAAISRLHVSFPLDQYFAGIAPDQAHAPVLEVLLPIHAARSGPLLGFVRYYIDARPLTRELAAIDARIALQTWGMLGVSGVIVGLVIGSAAWGLARAQRAVAARNESLTRAHFELTLAAKASALGQITSHLIHGLQGPIAGLRAAVADPAQTDWDTAAAYTERLQAMIQETVALLRDIGANASYAIDGAEILAAIRERNDAAARQQGLVFELSSSFAGQLDSHRGGVLCLIANNLVQNAFAATAAGRRVGVALRAVGAVLQLEVSDQGPGIPELQRAQLFIPGRSGRPGGSGLGLAISQLLARQIGAELVLAATGPEGTTFQVQLPLDQSGRAASGVASAGGGSR
ncbi:MAG: sensor histidine kinase [Opitutaceae bacterium]